MELFVFQNNPDNNRRSNQCTDSIDWQGISICRQLCSQITKQQEWCTAQYRSRNSDTMIGSTKQTAYQMWNRHTNKSNWSCKCSCSSCQQCNRNNNKQTRTTNIDS